MVALVITCSVITVTGFIVGWLLADNYFFWKRQDWASNVEGRF